MDYQIDAQELIDILTVQRNIAMDEVARQGAIIKSLERKLSEKVSAESGLEGLERARLGGSSSEPPSP